MTTTDEIRMLLDVSDFIKNAVDGDIEYDCGDMREELADFIIKCGDYIEQKKSRKEASLRTNI